MLYVNPMAYDMRAMPGDGDTPARRDTALREFERLFLYQLLREMRQTVPEDTLFGKSASTEFFNDMYDDAVAGKMVESGQLGIARQIAAQMDAKPGAYHRNSGTHAAMFSSPRSKMPITVEAGKP